MTSDEQTGSRRSGLESFVNTFQAPPRGRVPRQHDNLSRLSYLLRRQFVFGLFETRPVIIRVVLPFLNTGKANSLIPLVSLPEPLEKHLIDFLRRIFIPKQFVDLSHAAQCFNSEVTATQTKLTFIPFGLHD